MDQISFKSRIRAVSDGEFYNAALKIGLENSVKHPWTPKEAIKAIGARTTGVEDCSALALTDGKKVFLMHLNTDCDIYEVTQQIHKNVDIKDSNLQAVIVGGKETPVSQEFSQKLVNFIQKQNIPLTELRVSAKECSLNIGYHSHNDEWLINCSQINELIKQGITNSAEIFKKIFKTIKIADCDELA